MGRFSSLAKVAVAALALSATSACVAQYRNHGWVPSDSALSEIQVGISTRESVAASVGVPTTGGVLNESGYYYVESRWRMFGFYEPQVVSRELVAVRFNGSGTVSNIERFTLADGRVVPISRRVTDNAVGDTGFLRQLLGSIGNFDAGAIVGSE